MLQRALATLDPKAPICHKLNPIDYSIWCDKDGPGGFMGHTCVAISEVAPWPAEAMEELIAVSTPGLKNEWVRDRFLSPTKTEPTEKVNHPAHYGGDTVYEAIKVIDAWELGFELGNTVKYIKRSGKDIEGQEFFGLHHRIEDLRKAEWYLHHKIEQLQKHLKPQSPISDIKSNEPLCVKCGVPLSLGHSIQCNFYKA